MSGTVDQRLVEAARQAAIAGIPVPITCCARTMMTCIYYTPNAAAMAALQLQQLQQQSGPQQSLQHSAVELAFRRSFAPLVHQQPTISSARQSTTKRSRPASSAEEDYDSLGELHAKHRASKPSHDITRKSSITVKQERHISSSALPFSTPQLRYPSLIAKDSVTSAPEDGGALPLAAYPAKTSSNEETGEKLVAGGNFSSVQVGNVAASSGLEPPIQCQNDGTAEDGEKRTHQESHQGDGQQLNFWLSQTLGYAATTSSLPKISNSAPADIYGTAFVFPSKGPGDISDWSSGLEANLTGSAANSLSLSQTLEDKIHHSCAERSRDLEESSIRTVHTGPEFSTRHQNGIQPSDIVETDLQKGMSQTISTTLSTKEQPPGLPERMQATTIQLHSIALSSNPHIPSHQPEHVPSPAMSVGASGASRTQASSPTASLASELESQQKSNSASFQQSIRFNQFGSFPKQKEPPECKRPSSGIDQLHTSSTFPNDFDGVQLVTSQSAQSDMTALDALSPVLPPGSVSSDRTRPSHVLPLDMSPVSIKSPSWCSPHTSQASLELARQRRKNLLGSLLSMSSNEESSPLDKLHISYSRPILHSFESQISGPLPEEGQPSRDCMQQQVDISGGSLSSVSPPSAPVSSLLGLGKPQSKETVAADSFREPQYSSAGSPDLDDIDTNIEQISNFLVNDVDLFKGLQDRPASHKWSSEGGHDDWKSIAAVRLASFDSVISEDLEMANEGD